jgi:DNA-binding NarL/FixJ family response regulator
MQPHPAAMTSTDAIDRETITIEIASRQLSPRQVEALQGLAAGKSRAQVARDMNISVHTLKSYLFIAFRRLGARNAPEAVAIMARKQMLDVIKQPESMPVAR